MNLVYPSGAYSPACPDFDKAALIPCVVQDAATKDMLMLAYMNEEAYRQTVTTGTLTFYSRSRSQLWVKGETSGNTLSLTSLSLDCDRDTLLAVVSPRGPVCHLGTRTCFDGEPPDSPDMLTRLYDRVLTRKKEPQQGSYTNYLFDQGLDKILKKVGEEAAEVIIAAKNQSPAEVAGEAADLLYHLWVLLAELGLSPEQIYQVLEKRSQGRD